MGADAVALKVEANPTQEVGVGEATLAEDIPPVAATPEEAKPIRGVAIPAVVKPIQGVATLVEDRPTRVGIEHTPTGIVVAVGKATTAEDAATRGTATGAEATMAVAGATTEAATADEAITEEATEGDAVSQQDVFTPAEGTTTADASGLARTMASASAFLLAGDTTHREGADTMTDTATGFPRPVTRTTATTVTSCMRRS